MLLRYKMQTDYGDQRRIILLFIVKINESHIEIPKVCKTTAASSKISPMIAKTRKNHTKYHETFC